MSIINIDLSDTIASWRTKNNQLATNVGDLTLLTDSASSIVASINSLQAGLDSDIIALGARLDSDIAAIQANTVAGIDSDLLELKTDVYGDSSGTLLSLTALNTTDQTSIIGAINELDRRLVDVYNSSGVLLNT